MSVSPQLYSSAAVTSRYMPDTHVLLKASGWVRMGLGEGFSNKSDQSLKQWSYTNHLPILWDAFWREQTAVRKERFITTDFLQETERAEKLQDLLSVAPHISAGDLAWAGRPCPWLAQESHLKATTRNYISVREPPVSRVPCCSPPDWGR